MKHALTLAAAIVALVVGMRRSSAQTAPEQEARTLYQEGLRHFNLAEYEAAIQSFREAYRRVQDPELLFNIAQAYRRTGPRGCHMALEFYRNYRGAITDPKRKEEIQPLLDEMERCDRAAAAPSASPTETPPAPPQPASPPAPDQGPPSRALPIALAVGGLAVGAGGALVLASIGWDSECKPFCSHDEVDGLRTRYAAGWVLVGVGAAAVAAAAIVWIAQPSSASRSSGVWLAPSVAGLRAGGTF